MTSLSAEKQTKATHKQTIAQLALKHIGKAELQLGSTTDFRRQWLLHHIKELSFQIGEAVTKRTRCKFGTPNWFIYSDLERELRSLVADLELELM